MNENGKQNKTLRIVIVLLIALLLSINIASTTYSKYIVSNQSSTSASIASFGKIELAESLATLNKETGKYELDENTLISAGKDSKNNYEKVIPGVDISKDTYVKITGKFDVSFELYVKVVKSNNFPEGVKCELTKDWEVVSKTDNSITYKYKFNYNVNSTGNETIPLNQKIYLLDNKQLTVLESFKWKESTSFKLTFSAWIKQLD